MLLKTSGLESILSKVVKSLSDDFNICSIFVGQKPVKFSRKAECHNLDSGITRKSSCDTG